MRQLAIGALMIVTGCSGDLVSLNPPAYTRPDLFVSTSTDEAAQRISTACAANGRTFERQQVSLTCSAVMTGKDRMFATASSKHNVTGDAFSVFRFVLSPAGAGTRIEASHWVRSRDQVGALHEEELADDRHVKAMSKMLHDLGARPTI